MRFTVTNGKTEEVICDTDSKAGAEDVLQLANAKRVQRGTEQVYVLGEYDDSLFTALCSELIGKDTPEMELDRKRDRSGRINHLENSPETYGNKRDFDTRYTMHTGGQGCDCELTETERTLVAVASHNGNAEEPLAKTPFAFGRGSNILV